MYALKSSESRRQYPRRLKLFFDSIGLSGTLNEQAIEFLKRSKADINTQQDTLLRFLDFHKERVRRKELSAGTVKNYYRAATTNIIATTTTIIMIVVIVALSVLRSNYLYPTS